MKRGGDGYCCGRVVVGGFVFFKLSSMYRCYFAWVVVVACLALSLSTVRYLSLSLSLTILMFPMLTALVPPTAVTYTPQADV